MKQGEILTAIVEGGMEQLAGGELPATSFDCEGYPTPGYLS